MNLLFRLLLLMVATTCLLPVNGCGKEEPSETREFQIKYFRHKLFDFTFTDKMNGWICGDYGLIWKTTDGGETWNPLKSNTILPLRGISFSDTKRGWVVGDQGTILHTDNGGETWIIQKSDTTEHLQDVAFLDDRTGFVVGVFATLLKTEDGGQSWKNISEKIKEQETELQFFITEEDVSESDEETPIEETLMDEDIDVGEEGMPVLEPLLNNIYFLNETIGWIVGEEGNIFSTQDGGDTWKKHKSGVKDDLFAVYFKSPDEGWITGLNGLLLHTVDGGTVWGKQECPVVESLFAIAVTETRGYAVGNAASMITTSDGGKTWQEFTPGDIVLYSWIRALKETDGKFIAIGGLGTILICEDGEENWRQIL